MAPIFHRNLKYFNFNFNFGEIFANPDSEHVKVNIIKRRLQQQHIDAAAALRPRQMSMHRVGLSSAITRLSLALLLISSLAVANCQICGQPAVPLNAKVQTISGDTGIIEAKYECDSGYELFGPRTIKCDPFSGWERELPFCGTNVAYRKPVNQSSYTRAGPANFANDGNPGNKNPDGQQCSETQKEPSPWWRVDLLAPQAVRVVRITTRGCCGHQPLQDLEIRVGNSSADLQRNPLCAWYPGTVEEGITKTFSCARPLIGQYVAIQLVGVEGSLSLCEVEVFTNDEFSVDRCLSPNLSVETVLTTFSKTCYEFHVTKGENFEKAQQMCKSTGGNLVHDFRGAANDYILAELERRKSELKTQLVWIGAQKEPGITSRTWKWVNGEVVQKPAWGKDQPNNYNGEQNCVVLDGGRNWLWNDVGCNLDYLHFICQHSPLSCGSPDSQQNTTIVGRNYTLGNKITYQCPKGHSLIGDAERTCRADGTWGGRAPTCKYVDCGALPELEHGAILLSEQRTSYGVQATYTCHENYTLIGNENRTCELTGWTGKQPECLVDWCPEPPRIAGGSVSVTDKRAGSTATYECEAGYVLVGEPIISCGLGGEWSSKPPSCRFVDCGAPARPDRGHAMLVNSSTTVGSMVKYECEDDYWLDGPSELYCTKEGKWSGDAPICELVACDTPHVPAGSFVVGYDYNVHSKIQYNCDPGHVLRGNPTLECLETGEWSADAPFCEYIDCGVITPIPYGSVKYTQNTTYVGSEVTFSCTQSHKLSGVPKRVCLESGVWSDASPKCEEIRCSEPVLAAHSLLSVTGNDRMYGRTLIRTADSTQNSAQTYKIGALAKYRCERGYKMVGEALVTCEDNGQWSGAVPECVYVECGVPANITNGKVTLATNVTYYGAAALYECNPNFKLDGVSRRLCAEDGTWSHEKPACREITCDEPDISENLIVDVADHSVGAQAKFKCAKGRTLIGNDTRVCQKNGKWAGKSPSCKPVDCGRPPMIENGRVIVVNESTLYGGSAEYHCIPSYNRIGQYLRKCTEDGTWSGDEPRCEVAATEAQESSSLGTGIAIGATVIIVLLFVIGLIFLHRNKARPVKNTENVQAAETKDERNAAVMSYSTLEANNRMHLDNGPPATFNTFQVNGRGGVNGNASIGRKPENIYDQIPSEQFYDAPYEMRTNDEVYEPEPTAGNVITINGISVR
ncbi:sushi, von Willebrand factor type A, EGF and pentraxin domain-containing protein 1 [Anastrepha obliqua]|uniref:sushi, von Willebrand factor type A, EGF and pentraxin domain-containing protein 1 n=1 Tax=Anastrepha obliqua TaxID=95512 RepID=UPI00240A618C|nr:sushi, von Willebrand factor type A, EGF and pentraxin domain-containing protein 1 [Anastrepha obliqua]